ncbi:MAG: pyridoxamine 5'-phosphate oxidase [Gemmatimonadetes bacterium]|nr:pyridoxamine 5'-phosphate oxidase [Gemmatimonadota bacterium]
MDPISRFIELLQQASARADIPEPTATAVATADAQGRPAVRMLLLKGVDQRGFVYFTNLESRKGREITENPNVALCIHWQPLEVQVRVEGPVERVSDQEADEYFATRARGSQLGAWASLQSRPLADRAELEARIRAIEQRYEGTDVPRPPYWTGFRVVPQRIEFWSGRNARLHDREVYHADRQGGWRVERLYP